MAFDTHPEVSTADVQAAAGANGSPATDAQQIMQALDLGFITHEQAFVLVVGIIRAHGVLKGDTADWAALALKIGPDLLEGAAQAAALLVALT